jgi:hypothetical protein
MTVYEELKAMKGPPISRAAYYSYQKDWDARKDAGEPVDESK